MAYEDNTAFDNMNKADPDMDITGGAITYSKYEMDMTPNQQKKYKDRILSQLGRVYNADPLRRDLSFKSWLKEARVDRIKSYSDDWERVRVGAPDPISYRSAMDAMDPGQSRFTEEVGILMRDLESHTGDFSDIRDIVGSDEPIKPTAIEEPQRLQTRRGGQGY